jgi:hemimethylated DNA binding protein
MSKIRNAKYQIGQVVRHRLYPFRGVVFDIDPVFDNTDEWYEAIPAVLSSVRRERRDRIRRLRVRAEFIAGQ